MVGYEDKWSARRQIVAAMNLEAMRDREIHARDRSPEKTGNRAFQSHLAQQTASPLRAAFGGSAAGLAIDGGAKDSVPKSSAGGAASLPGRFLRRALSSRANSSKALFSAELSDGAASGAG